MVTPSSRRLPSSTPLTVVFDLDGTLIDTAPDLVEATNHILKGLKLAPVKLEKFKMCVGLGARQMIVQGLSDAKVRLAEHEIDQLLADFLVYYGDNIAHESRPYPGAVAALDRLEAAGHRLAICTNKSEHLARKLMDTLGLANRFAVIAGRDTFEVSKPDPGHLTGTIAMAGGVVETALMIGDSATDVNTARAANILVIGVTHGYTDRPIEDLNPDAVIEHFDALDSAIQGMTAIP